MTIDLRHLRCFLTIAQELNITRAAAVLRLSQPALSRTLGQLEAHLGIRLVDRSTHHLHLTDAGESFRHKAFAAVTAFDEAIDPTVLGHWPLRLGYSWSALGIHTPTLLRQWAERHPAILLRLLRSDDRTGGLHAGLADAALIRGHPAGAPFISEFVTSEARVAAVPVGSELAAQDELSLTQLAEHTVAVNPTSGTTTVDLWPADQRPRSTIEVANTDDWLMMISGGRAFGVTSTATAEMHRHPGVTYRPIVDAPAMPVYLCWAHPPGHAAVPQLLELIREVVT